VFAVVRGFGATDGIVNRVKGFILANVSGSQEQQETLAGYIDTFAGNVNAGQIGWLSLIILVVSVLLLLGHIEGSFNAIFGVTSERPLIGRMLIYWSVLTFGPLLLALSFAITAGQQIAVVERLFDGLGAAWGAILAVAPLVATWIAFAVMYLVVPATRVRFSAAALAAVVAGSAWHISKWGYSAYVSKSVAQGAIYGSVAAIPFFIVWLYVSWLLVLFGAQLAFAFQNAETYRADDERVTASESYLERAVCRLFLEVSREFFAGRPPPTPEDLVKKLRVPRRLLSRLVDRLRAGGLLRSTEPDGGLAPGRDLSTITVHTVLEQLRAGEGPDPTLVTDPARTYFDGILGEVDLERARLSEGLSFRELAAQLDPNANTVLEGEQRSDVH
jgi:membrane protein